MRGDCVEPSAAARPARGRAELAPHSVEHIAESIILGREGSFTDARGVSFHHADDGVHAVRRHTRPGAGASGRGIRAGDKRIRSVVDIEVGALRAFEEQAFAAGHGVVQPNDGIGHVGTENFRRGEIALEQRLVGDRFRAE